MVNIKLSRGLSALIDDGDFELVSQFNWHAIKCKAGFYYAHRFEKIEHSGGPGTGRNSRWRSILLHRWLLDVRNPGVQVDHRNGDTLDCRRLNLRIASASQNNRNRPKLHGYTSRFKGVHLDQYGYWRAQISIKGKSTYLGSFTDEEEAAMVFDHASRKLAGEYARFNFPTGGEQAAVL